MGEKNKITLSEAPQKISLAKIQENPHNPRKHFDEEGIKELANNINEVGLLQPIRVRPIKGEFQIVHGHRRFRAVKLLEWETIPATVSTMSEQEAYEVSLSENILRADLSAIEEAEGFQRLIAEYDYTQQDVAKKFGKSQQFVSSRLALLKLHESVKEKITTRVVSPSHGELLAQIDNTKLQTKLANDVEQDGLSVRKLERILRNLTSEVQPEPSTKDAIGASEEQSESSESSEQESVEQPQEAEVIEEEEPEQLPPIVETESQSGEDSQEQSVAQEPEQLSLAIETTENNLDNEENRKKTTDALPSELTILNCLNEPLRGEFQKHLHQLNEYTHQLPRQEKHDDAIKICVEIKDVALSMKETLEKSKAAVINVAA